MTRLPVHALLLLSMALPSHATGAEDLQAGMWDLTLHMTVSATGQAMGPFNHAQCLTTEDAQNPEKLFAETGANCRYGNRQHHGSRFSFTVQCTGDMPVSGSGWVEYSSSRFQGEMLLTADIAGAGAVETRSQVSGTRQGPCK